MKLSRGIATSAVSSPMSGDYFRNFHQPPTKLFKAADAEYSASLMLIIFAADVCRHYSREILSPNMMHTTKKGEKEKLVELARTNAALVLNTDKERLKREEGRTIGAVKEIEKLLGISKIKNSLIEKSAGSHFVRTGIFLFVHHERTLTGER